MAMPDSIDTRLFDVLWDVRKESAPNPKLDDAVIWARQIKARHTIGECMRRCGVGSPRYLAVEEEERKSLEYLEAVIGRHR